MMNNLKRIIFVIIPIVVFLAMISVAVFIRNEYKKTPGVLEQISGKSITSEEWDIAIKLDSYRNITMYRRIWTFNTIIFLSGFLLVYSINSKREN